jgi:hypothetical protein
MLVEDVPGADQRRLATNHMFAAASERIDRQLAFFEEGDFDLTDIDRARQARACGPR